MPKYVYRPDKAGNPKAVVITEKLGLRGTPDECTKPFHQKVLYAYKQAEEAGHKFSVADARQIRRVHEQAQYRAA